MSSAPDQGTAAGTTTAPEQPDQPGQEKAGPPEALARLLDSLRSHLAGSIVGSELTERDLLVRVERRAWRRVAEFCRAELDMDYFCFLSGIDWMPDPGLSGEKVWDEGAAGDGDGEGPAPAGGGPEPGVTGGDTRFQVLARLYSTRRKAGLTLKADLDDADPRVDSWTPVYPGADWHERETWEMLGFDFDGHPGLRHLYLPGDFEGHPLRKDFPLLAREVKPWPGLVDVEALPGEEEAAAGGADDAGPAADGGTGQDQ